MTGLSAPTGQFLRSEAEVILATDFFTVDLLDGTTVYVLAVIEHATRRIRILGITPHPAGAWVTQQARNLLMDLDGQAATIKFLIRDRDTKFTAAFDEVLHAAHIRILKGPVQAPQGERGHGAVDRRMPTGAAQPHPDLGTAASPAGAATARDPPQRTPAAPAPRAGRTTQAGARRRR
jgi:hypothetical protein